MKNLDFIEKEAKELSSKIKACTIEYAGDKKKVINGVVANLKIGKIATGISEDDIVLLLPQKEDMNGLYYLSKEESIAVILMLIGAIKEHDGNK